MQKNRINRRIPDLENTNENNISNFVTTSFQESDDFTCFGITKKEFRVQTLKVILKNDGVALIQYGRMATPIIFDGKSILYIEAPQIKLKIFGENLLPLIDYLADQRLAWIKPFGSGGKTEEFKLDNNEPKITKVLINDKEEIQISQ